MSIFIWAFKRLNYDLGHFFGRLRQVQYSLIIIIIIISVIIIVVVVTISHMIILVINA